MIKVFSIMAHLYLARGEVFGIKWSCAVGWRISSILKRHYEQNGEICRRIEPMHKHKQQLNVISTDCLLDCQETHHTWQSMITIGNCIRASLMMSKSDRRKNYTSTLYLILCRSKLCVCLKLLKICHIEYNFLRLTFICSIIIS